MTVKEHETRKIKRKFYSVQCVISVVIAAQVGLSMCSPAPPAYAASIRDGIHTPIYAELACADREELADMRSAEPWAEPWSLPISQEELDLFAALVMAEAGDQGYYGMQLVADVVLNRVDSPAWPNTITDVIWQRNQFSPTFDGGLQRGYALVTQECYGAVLTELQGPRIDYDIQYFSMYGCANGTFAFQYRDHYFGY